MSTSISTFQVADATKYAQGFYVQIDQEPMYVLAAPAGSIVTVLRAARGGTAANHAAGATVLIRPHFFDLEYFDALNAAVDALWPFIYVETAPATTATVSGTYEYAIPIDSGNGAPIRAISKIEFKETGDLVFREIHDWDVARGATLPTATGVIKLRRDRPPGLLRITGFSPPRQFTTFFDSLASVIPIHSTDLLPLYAAQHLLMSGEARRAREDTGARDDRENANRHGTSGGAAQGLLQRFQIRLSM